MKHRLWLRKPFPTPCETPSKTLYTTIQNSVNKRFKHQSLSLLHLRRPFSSTFELFVLLKFYYESHLVGEPPKQTRDSCKGRLSAHFSGLRPRPKKIPMASHRCLSSFGFLRPSRVALWRFWFVVWGVLHSFPGGVWMFSLHCLAWWFHIYVLLR